MFIYNTADLESVKDYKPINSNVDWDDIENKPEEIMDIENKLDEKLDVATYNTDKENFVTNEDMENVAYLEE